MIYIVLIVVFLVIWLINRKNASGISQISVQQLKDILPQTKKLFLDVRTPSEYKASHIKQFHNMPLGTKWSGLPKDQDIVVICQSGMRSMQACKQLKKLGYDSVINVKGGMSAYKAMK